MRILRRSKSVKTSGSISNEPNDESQLMEILQSLLNIGAVNIDVDALLYTLFKLLLECDSTIVDHFVECNAMMLLYKLLTDAEEHANEGDFSFRVILIVRCFFIVFTRSELGRLQAVNTSQEAIVVLLLKCAVSQHTDIRRTAAAALCVIYNMNGADKPSQTLELLTRSRSVLHTEHS